MQDADIISIWKSYNQKLEETLRLNREQTLVITKLKVKSFISSMRPIKIFTVSIGILWVAFLDILILNTIFIASPFLLISAGLLSILNKLAIGVYIYQLVLINKVDINTPVLVAQANMARLKSSTLWIARILFLQLPLWTIFYWNNEMLLNGNWILWSIQILVTSAFTYVAIWLFLNIKYENRSKKWFNIMFGGSEWQPILESIRLLEEIEEFRST